MGDLIVLGIVLLALHKLPDGDLKQNDRSRNIEIDIPAVAKYCDCGRCSEDILQDRQVHRKDRSDCEAKFR